MSETQINSSQTVSTSGSSEETKKNMEIPNDGESEPFEDYRIGGYHPVHIGEIFGNRYQICQKLGWGHFSTVWLAFDLQTGKYVAAKVQKGQEKYYESAMDEIQILSKISNCWEDPDWVSYAQKYLNGVNDFSCCVQLLNSFDFYGPNGKHLIMVFELMGLNLLDVARFYKYKGIPIKIAKSIIRELLVGLDYLHRICNLIHTDIKPENVILYFSKSELDLINKTGSLPHKEKFTTLNDPQNIHVKWADFGNACFRDHHFTSRIQTREYRAPETILKAEYDTSTDIWSFGCMVFELVTGDYLFRPKPGESYKKNDDHLAQIIELIGYPPTAFAQSGKKSKVFF